MYRSQNENITLHEPSKLPSEKKKYEPITQESVRSIQRSETGCFLESQELTSLLRWVILFI